MRKLRAWYVQHDAETHGYTEATIKAALEVLVDGLPMRDRERVTAALLDVIAEVYEANNQRAPGWLRTTEGVNVR